MNCRSYEINVYVRDKCRDFYKTSMNGYVNNRSRSFNEDVARICNSFSPLLNHVEFYKYNYWHKEGDYKNNIIMVLWENGKEECTKAWKRQQEKLEECGFSLST